MLKCTMGCNHVICSACSEVCRMVGSLQCSAVQRFHDALLHRQSKTMRTLLQHTIRCARAPRCLCYTVHPIMQFNRRTQPHIFQARLWDSVGAQYDELQMNALIATGLKLDETGQWVRCLWLASCIKVRLTDFLIFRRATWKQMGGRLKARLFFTGPLTMGASVQ